MVHPCIRPGIRPGLRPGIRLAYAWHAGGIQLAWGWHTAGVRLGILSLPVWDSFLHIHKFTNSYVTPLASLGFLRIRARGCRVPCLRTFVPSAASCPYAYGPCCVCLQLTTACRERHLRVGRHLALASAPPVSHELVVAHPAVAVHVHLPHQRLELRVAHPIAALAVRREHLAQLVRREEAIAVAIEDAELYE